MQLQKTLEQIGIKKCVIEVFGIGYVGFPLSVRLASSGFNVVGVDMDSKKIKRLKNNSLLDTESHLQEEYLGAIQNGNLLLTEHAEKSIDPKIGIICVPTPIPNQTRKSDVYVKSAVDNFLKTCKKGDMIIIESSIEVGTTDRMKEIINSKGFHVGQDFGLCFCPERIDPQNKNWRLENIPRIIYCSDNTSYEIAKKIYHYINNSNLHRLDSAKVAEVVKSFENAFRLVNISLVNELAVLCDKLKINVKDVIDAASTKPFGFMPFYSGAGAGGHCIPKDPRFLLESAKNMKIEFKTIENALAINSFIPRYIADSIEGILVNLKLSKSVLVCGLSYKSDIEDMRDSPGFKIIKELNKRGYKVGAYDPFYKDEAREKYLEENNLSKLHYELMSDLNSDSIKDFSCICIVQHHTKLKFRLSEIYTNSLIPVIYDCQDKLTRNPKSKTVLKMLGG